MAAWISPSQAAIYFPGDPIYLWPAEGNYGDSIKTARIWKFGLLILLRCIKKWHNGCLCLRRKCELQDIPQVLAGSGRGLIPYMPFTLRASHLSLASAAEIPFQSSAWLGHPLHPQEVYPAG